VALATLFAGDDPADSDGTSAAAWALYTPLWRLPLALLAALGVACRLGVRAIRRR